MAFLSRARRLGLLAIVVATLPAACASPSPSPSLAVAPAGPTPVAARTALPTDTPGPTPPSSLAPAPLDLAHRQFTVLVLGLDYDGRSDSISLVGVDPLAKAVRIASIPRDTIDVPLPGGGTFSKQKINAFYNVARADPARYPQGPKRAVADLVSRMLGVRVDYVATTSFGGFVRLVDSIGGVTITLPAPIADPHYQVTTTEIGVRFPAGKQTLTGERALIFVRTRYSDNDFERQRRQHAFLAAVAKELAADPTKLAPLLVAAATNVDTDLPVAELPALLASAGSPGDWSYADAVLGPSRYESAGTCACGYALVPKLDEMRKLAASYFPWAVLP